jgi:phosphotransferase system enzyme I (PtsP)
MSAASIGPVKAMIMALDTQPLAALLDRALDSRLPDDALRQTLSDFAESHGIPL